MRAVSGTKKFVGIGGMAVLALGAGVFGGMATAPHAGVPKVAVVQRSNDAKPADYSCYGSLAADNAAPSVPVADAVGLSNDVSAGHVACIDSVGYFAPNVTGSVQYELNGVVVQPGQYVRILDYNGTDPITNTVEVDPAPTTTTAPVVAPVQSSGPAPVPAVVPAPTDTTPTTVRGVGGPTGDTPGGGTAMDDGAAASTTTTTIRGVGGPTGP